MLPYLLRKLVCVHGYIVPLMITAWLAPASVLADPGDELFKLTASDGVTGDAFGNTNAVAISGNIALIGARLHEADGIGFSGAAYLYDLNTGAELAKLTQSDAEFLDLFGSAVGISGDRAVIGSFGSGDASENTGAAYLFDVSDPTNPFELHKLLPSEGEQSDSYGEAAAISGNLALVGATGRFQNTSIGKAYLYDATTGDELAVLSDSTPGNTFGFSVAISGNTAIVGAIGDEDAGFAAGAAYLFDVSDPQNPVELHKLVASDTEANDQFGWSVTISGNTALVGARNDSDDGSRSGSAYLFDVTTGNELAKLTASDAAEGDEFGTAVAISDNTILIGANLNDDAGNSSGSAYLFDATTFLELDKLTASSAASGDSFGRAVAIDGAFALVGANGDNSGTGAAYAYSAVPEPTTCSMLVTALACAILAAPCRARLSHTAASLRPAKPTCPPVF